MAKSRFSPGNMFMIIIIAIAIVFLYGQFTVDSTGVCTQADVDNDDHGCAALGVGGVWEGIDFNAPSQTELESSTLWIIKLLILGTAIFGAYMIVSKSASGRLSRRDVMSLVIMGVAVYMIWVYFIEPSNLLGATDFGGLTLDNIAQKTAQNLGLN
jgi:hypothetical protein